MIKEITIRSKKREELINLDGFIDEFVRSSGVQEGILTVFVPHTTAAVTINENADPNVARDIAARLSRLAPRDDAYEHAESNADAHIKASLLGQSAAVIISSGRPMLGTWQSLFFCEFDGPRTRRVMLRIG